MIVFEGWQVNAPPKSDEYFRIHLLPQKAYLVRFYKSDHSPMDDFDELPVFYKSANNKILLKTTFNFNCPHWQ